MRRLNDLRLSAATLWADGLTCPLASRGDIRRPPPRAAAPRGSLLQVGEEVIDAFFSVLQRHAQLALPLHHSQRAYQYRPKRPVLLAVDQELGEGAALRGTPEPAAACPLDVSLASLLNRRLNLGEIIACRAEPVVRILKIVSLGDAVFVLVSDRPATAVAVLGSFMPPTLSMDVQFGLWKFA
jgi:hypothetical protein